MPEEQSRLFSTPPGVISVLSVVTAASVTVRMESNANIFRKRLVNTVSEYQNTQWFSRLFQQDGEGKKEFQLHSDYI